MWLYITFLFWIKVRFAFKKIFLFNLQINVLYTTPFFYSCFLRWFSLSFSCHTRSADLILQPLYDVRLYYMCLCSSSTYTHSRMYTYTLPVRLYWRTLFKTFLADGCDKKRCDFYATCETDEMGRAECVCPKACTKVRCLNLTHSM